MEKIEASLFSKAMKRPVASQALIDGFTLADKDTQINFNMTQGDVAKVDVDSDERPRRIALSEREARQFNTYMESIHRHIDQRFSGHRVHTDRRGFQAVKLK